MGKNYTLMRGDTRLGILTQCEIDQPWFLCHFVADAPFTEVRPLFEAELEAEQIDEDVWMKMYASIEALNLYLVSDDGMHIGPLLLHIHDDEAWFRY